MSITAKEKAIYRESRKERVKRVPGKPDYTRRKVHWGGIRTKDELEALYKRILPELRRIAYHSGYGLGVHGTMRRDLDLIAVPWTRKAVSKNTLVQRMELSMCGWRHGWYDWSSKPKKPFGREAVVFHISMNAVIDLSVMPRHG